MTAERRIEDQAGGTYGSVEAAAGWRRSGVARAQVLAPLTERMLDLAGVSVGSRVLDIAAGTGEQTLRRPDALGRPARSWPPTLPRRCWRWRPRRRPRRRSGTWRRAYWTPATSISSRSRSTPPSSGWR